MPQPLDILVLSRWVWIKPKVLILKLPAWVYNRKTDSRSQVWPKCMICLGSKAACPGTVFTWVWTGSGPSKPNYKNGLKCSNLTEHDLNGMYSFVTVAFSKVTMAELKTQKVSWWNVKSVPRHWASPFFFNCVLALSFYLKLSLRIK